MFYDDNTWFFNVLAAETTNVKRENNGEGGHFLTYEPLRISYFASTIFEFLFTY